MCRRARDVQASQRAVCARPVLDDDALFEGDTELQATRAMVSVALPSTTTTMVIGLDG